MAIKGLAELLAKYRNNEITDAQMEEELGKALATDFIPKAKFNEINEAKKLAESNLSNAQKTLEELKSKGDLSEEYKAQIAKLTADNAKAQESFKAQITRMKMDNAIDSALTSSKARNSKAARALLDESKISIAEDGTVKGLSEQIEAIRKENAFLFDIEPEPQNPKPSWGNVGKQNPSGDADALEAAMFAAAGLGN